jgi:hypothetical protein
MNKIIVLLLTLMLTLNACSPFAVVEASGEQPEPVVAVESAVTEEQPEPVVVVESAATEEQPASVGVSIEGYTPVKAAQLQVEAGPDSSMPVFVRAYLDLPDSCAQVEQVRTIQDGDIFYITIGTTPSQAEGCIQDTLPFMIRVPLNVLDLYTGTYTVDVNGVTTTFELDSVPAAFDLRTADMPNYLDDVLVNDVMIEVGRGSPLPVHAVISANLPKSCGQLGEMQMHREGNVFYVRLIAELPAQTDCNNDPLPLRVEVPLNISGLPEGTYEVVVNGVSATFELPFK